MATRRKPGPVKNLPPQRITPIEAARANAMGRLEFMTPQERQLWRTAFGTAFIAVRAVDPLQRGIIAAQQATEAVHSVRLVCAVPRDSTVGEKAEFVQARDAMALERY
jgi:hypothetical protein